MRWIAVVVGVFLVVGCSDDGPSADAVSPTSDSSDATDSVGAHTNDPEGTHPRLLLLNGNGNPVEAIVDQVSTWDEATPGNQFNPSGQKKVLVEAIRENELPLGRLQLVLSAGKLKAYPPKNPVYKDSNCSGSGYLREPGFSGSGANLKWTKGTVESTKANQLYHQPQGTCEQFRSNGQEVRIYPLKQVPSELQDPFDTPPYTVSARY